MENKVVDALREAGAVMTGGPFKLSAGGTSDLYVDVRRVLGCSNPTNVIVESLDDDLQDDVLIGVGTGGIPWASIVSSRFESPFGYTNAKSHGTGLSVHGFKTPGVKVTVVDDVATSGASLVKAIAAVRAEGMIVDRAVVIFDREEGATEALAEIGVDLHSLSRRRDL